MLMRSVPTVRLMGRLMGVLNSTRGRQHIEMKHWQRIRKLLTALQDLLHIEPAPATKVAVPVAVAVVAAVQEAAGGWAGAAPGWLAATPSSPLHA